VKAIAQFVKDRIKFLSDLQDALQTAMRLEFSVIKKRADLVCPGIALPMGWDDTDATKRFGPLSITPVN
jgi:hypothetical protein